ncbi:hypothetical protein BDZ89DRAFT_1068929 [Hymenopellis radicata]|nr:hypothetical protein BDZ89DRAFT_1068929 [Hymenopellis radicata]
MPPRKRAKVAAEDEKENALPSAGRRRTGKRATQLKDISGLVDMPLDIWFEIFSLLSPADLLHMARATKVFRRTLMSRESITVWRHAREQFHPGLPDPSPLMSEPAWINLIFENRCHVCVKTMRRVIDWDLGIRICPKCIPKALMNVSDLTQDERIAGIHTMLFTLYDCQYKPFVWQDVVYRAQYEKVKARYECLETVEEKVAYTSSRMGEKWDVLSMAGKDWVDEEAEKHELELEHIRIGRRIQIFDKLKEEGYAEELEDDDCLDDIDDHPFMKQNRPLTDRTWNNQFDSMITFMNQVRAERLERKRQETIIRRQDEAIHMLKVYKSEWLERQTLTTRPLSLPGLLFNNDMGPCDWLAIPKVHALIELPDYDDIGFQRWWDGALSEVGELMTSWNEEILCELFIIQREAHPDFKDVVSLSRATSAYTCASCSMPLFYPDVLFHPCMTTISLLDDEGVFREEDSNSALELMEFGLYKRQTWSADCLSVDARLNAIIVNVVELVGLDPNVATVKDLDDLNVYIHLFNCPQVYEEKRGLDRLDSYLTAMKRAIPLTGSMQPRKYLFGWRKLVLALYEHGLTEPLRKGQNAEVIDASTVSEPYIAKIQDTQDWLCTECRDTDWEEPPKSLEEMQTHLLVGHGRNRADQREGVDYYRPLQPSEVARTSLVVPM